MAGNDSAGEIEQNMSEFGVLAPFSSNCSNSSDNSTVYDPDCYFYDYDASLVLPLEEVIPVSMIYGVTLLFGLIGNVLVILSISRFRRMRSITNVFLLSLATADLLLILICVPIKCAAFFSYTWTFGEFLCKFVAYMQNLSMICSVMTLTAMSIERFIAIKLPLRSKTICTMRHAQLVIVMVWLMSLVLATPILFGQKHIEVGTSRKGYWCLKEWSDPQYDILYEVYMFTIMFLLPVGIMVWSYTCVCFEVWKIIRVRSDMRFGSGGYNTNRKIHSVDQNCLQESDTSLITRKKRGSRKPYVDDARTRKQFGHSVSSELPWACIKIDFHFIMSNPNEGFGSSFCTTLDDCDKNVNPFSSVVVMLIVIVIVFAICWGPILINNVLVAFDVIPRLHHGFLKPLRQAFFLMSYCNSCVNPIVYGFMSKNFRDSFKTALCALCSTGSWRGRGRFVPSTFRTTTTFATRTDITPEKENICYSFDSRVDTHIGNGANCLPLHRIEHSRCPLR